MNVDTQQLLHFSKYYLCLAKRLKCPESELSKTIGQLYQEYPDNKKSNVYLLMAHLASAAYRAATIIDKHKLHDYCYRHLKDLHSSDDIASRLRSNLERYLPMLLRDLVGHSLQSKHRLAEPRQKVIHQLKPMQCMRVLQGSIRQIEEDLIDKQVLHSASRNRYNGAVKGDLDYELETD